MLIFKIRGIDSWEYLVYTIGLSVSFIMFAGLAVNWILPWLNITDKPLSLWPILICFDIILLIMGFFAFIRNKTMRFEPRSPKFSLLDRIFIIIPMFFPFMAVIGAFLLNNHGTNIITMIMLGLIAVYVLLIVIFRDHLDENVYPWAILMMSLSLLLMYSMRSWYISGYDITEEYRIFSIIQDYSYWNISLINHGYNTCLSITILPILVNLFIKITNEYLFKFIFQILFSLLPLTVYLLSKRFSNQLLAFLATFFFIEQFQFMHQMPSLIRQEIAFVFFGLILLVLFSKDLPSNIKKLLFVIFGFSMIVSHYSTSYIALAIFLLAYFLTFFYKLYENRKIKRGKIKEHEREKFYLTGVLVLLLLIFGFLWIAQLSNNTNGLVEVISNTIINSNKMFNLDMKSSSVLNSLWTNRVSYNYETLNNYIVNISPINNTINSTKDYTPRLIYSKNIDIKNKVIYNIFLYSHAILANIIKLSLIIGSLFIFIRKNREITKEYGIIVLLNVLLVVLLILLPYVSFSYNFERLYQQSLIILSLMSIFGIIFLLKIFFRKERIIYLIMVLILLFYFFTLNGFFYQIIGGVAYSNLNNFGDDFLKEYAKLSEFSSSRWLELNYNLVSFVQTDNTARLRLFTFSRVDNLKIINRIIPSSIKSESYIYSSETNIIEERAFSSYSGRSISYNYPIDFLDNNRNKIYTNGGSEIFK